MSELLTHNRGVASFLATARIEVNTSAAKYEAVTRALQENAALMKKVNDQQLSMSAELQQLKLSMAANTPEARNKVEQNLLKCKTAYAKALNDSYADAVSTGDVWKGPVDTTALMSQVISDTLGITPDEATALVNDKRELPLSAKDAKDNRKTPRMVPNAKMFNDRRATFLMQLGQVAVDAWKKKVGFPTDPDEVVEAAVKWVNRDKYLKSETGFAGIMDGVLAKFKLLGCMQKFWVEGAGVGKKGHVRALLGHVAVAAVKVRLELIKVIYQSKNPKFKHDNHRPYWVLEVHRVYFYLLGKKGSKHKNLVLIDQKVKLRAVVDRISPVPSLVTTAVLPSVAGSADPIGVADTTAASSSAAAEDAVGDDAAAAEDAAAADDTAGAAADDDGGSSDSDDDADAVAAAAAAAAEVLAAMGADV